MNRFLRWLLCSHGRHKWFRKDDWSYEMLKCKRCGIWWPAEDKGE